jgi:hypothetical protein
MTTLTLNRGEKTAIPFSITDVNNGLLGKRVTWSVAESLYSSSSPPAAPPAILKRASGLGASSAEVTIAVQTAALVTGTINLSAADYALLPKSQYIASLWIDDGAGNDSCVTADPAGKPIGFDVLNILAVAPR